MKEHPIIFSTDMVKAILDRLKTQTRRVIKPQPNLLPRNFGDKDDLRTWSDKKGFKGHTESVLKYLMPTGCPYGQAGDRLWVRETHYRWGCWVKNGFSKTGKQKWTFKATSDTVGGLRFPDNNPPFGESDRTQTGWHKRPSIHMFRKDSRITLEITEVRVERVQEITPLDCLKEGINLDTDMFPTINAEDKFRKRFQNLWDSLNAKGGYSWAKNPFVWAISFKVIK